MRKIWFISIFILFTYSSCSFNHFEENIRFENRNWVKFNELEFNIPVASGNEYEFTGNFITDSTFNRRKIEVGFYIYLPSGEERLTDLKFRILDYEYQALGRISEEGIINEVTFKENIRVNEEGNIKLKIVLHSQYYDNFGIIGLDLFVKEK